MQSVDQDQTDIPLHRLDALLYGKTILLKF